MKKGSIITGSVLLAGLTGYGAWSLYKKKNPQCAKKMKNEVKKITKNMEKSIEDMM